MPMPKPKDKEGKKDFLDRCMNNKVMIKEYPDNDQRYALCNSIWDDKERNMELRKAIAVHHTSVSSGAWDGPANEARLKTDQDEAYYRKAYAWKDSEGDSSKKASYKFIHHEISGDGNPGVANAKACITGIAVLNGARGGTKIPEEDKKGVWNHLAAHLKDADIEPPELKSNNMNPEYRSFTLVEVRTEDDPPKIIGHAAVFNQLSEKFGIFREKISPGAFKKTIQEADIRALWNHEPIFVLGRNKSGTLKLVEDDIGLRIEIDPPKTALINDLVIEPIRRGDVNQMSFAFRAVKEDWESEGENLTRNLKEIHLFDVSPVTFPAYPQTDVQVKSLISALRNYFPLEPLPAEHSSDKGEKERSLARQKLRHRKLEIAEKSI
jgi:hypothetical protein